MLLPGCEKGVANKLGYDVIQLSGPMGVTPVESVFFTDDVIQGSNGRGDPKAAFGFFGIKPDVNSSFIRNVEFSILS